jgi:hypothetical protein
MSFQSNRRFLISQTIFALLLAIGLPLVACKRADSLQPSSTPSVAATSIPKTPSTFGIYYEAPDGSVALETKPIVATARPSFLIYLEAAPEPAKVRLRFAPEASSTDIMVLKQGEEKGVFEASVTNIEGRKDLLRAVYAGSLKPGQYTAYYFIDQSHGGKAWEKAQFQFAGHFEVK